MASALGQSFPFLAIAAILFLGQSESTPWFPWFFMVFYGLFFVATGIHNNVVHTLNGKLVRTTHRGRLITVSLTLGCPASILVACLLMGQWLELPDRGFGYIFGFTGLVFFLIAGLAAFLAEPADSYSERANGFLHHFGSAVQLLRRDKNFRRLGIVAALFGTVLMLFPHYQAMGRSYLDLDLSNLLLWVSVQNSGTCVVALVAGPIADRYGNRLVVQLMTCCCAAPPLLAIVLGTLYPTIGREFFWTVFVLLGLTPVAIKILANYTLEIVEKSEHPRALSTMYLCLATPIILFSPVVGLAVSLTSFEAVFTAGAVCILSASVLTLGLSEPRKRI